MTSNRATQNDRNRHHTTRIALKSSYYALLGLHPSASVVEIRRSYRELSKQYHPDTTELPKAIATTKFQELNEAYATLSSPERRAAYDLKVGYSRIAVIQPLPNLHDSQNEYESSSAYLDPTDRPLSPGEIFALFILLVTFITCLLIAIAIGLTRPETIVPPLPVQNEIVPAKVTPKTPTIEAPANNYARSAVTINQDELNTSS